MKKIFKKTITLLLMLTINFIICTSIVYAEEVDTNPTSNPGYYKPGQLADAGKIKEVGNTIIGGIQFVGNIVSVIVLIVIGIRFIYGSAEERAQYKESFKPYLIGAVMLFSITNLLAILSGLFT